MPVEVTEQQGGRLMTVQVQVSGKLTKQDYRRLVSEFVRISKEHEKINVLFEMPEFYGWQEGEAWKEAKF